ncbi:MAG: lipopolysaccharide biosynthesis protein [Geobacteraceae bacterium GWC2_58_44]|nr:MAG: lipopolysaccharide biosynthesis protein [Geobacteraceae bacterium GWC2_58_44]HBG07401.1 lipopolysaccharide biosynthesis protein [Geobacter sp.]
MSIRDIMTVLFKHKGKILLVFIAITTAISGGTFLLTPVYEAKSSLLVKLWKEDSSRLGIGTGNSGTNLMLSQDELANTEIQVLTSRELAEKVITTMGLQAIYPDLALRGAKNANPIAVAVDSFGKSLKVSGVRKSNVISVSFQHRDPKIAAGALNLLVDAFKEKHLLLHSDPQSSFIGTQLESFQNKLRDSERSLQEFQQANRVFSLEEQRSLLLRQRTDLDTSYKTARNSISENSNKISALRAQMHNVANSKGRYTNTERDKIITDAKSKLLELQLKEQELRRKYTESNRLVVNARREVELVNQFLKEQEEGIAGKVKTGNPVYQNLEIELFKAEGELNAQSAKAEALRVQLRQLDNEIAALDLNENKVQNLKREIAINEKNYQTYADRQEEARISDAMNKLKLSNISVIQAAAVPTRPIKPNNRLNVMLGIFLGIIASLTVAYLSESMAQTFSDPESIENYLELPVLLTIPDKEV